MNEGLANTDDGYEFYVDKHWNVIEKAGSPKRAYDCAKAGEWAGEPQAGADLSGFDELMKAKHSIGDALEKNEEAR
jgi:hypothetical protein